MQIPERLLVEIVLFVSQHYDGRGLRSSSQMMGASCGELAAGWYLRHPMIPPVEIGDQLLVIAICQRLGKSLGSFYLLEKEGVAWQQSAPQPT